MKYRQQWTMCHNTPAQKSKWLITNCQIASTHNAVSYSRTTDQNCIICLITNRDVKAFGVINTGCGDEWLAADASVAGWVDDVRLWAALVFEWTLRSDRWSWSCKPTQTANHDHVSLHRQPITITCYKHYRCTSPRSCNSLQLNRRHS